MDWCHSRESWIHFVIMSELFDLNSMSLGDLFAELNPTVDLVELFERLRQEDLNDLDDVTTRLIVDPDRIATGRLVARQAGVLAGLPIFDLLCSAYGFSISFRPLVSDGERLEPGTVIVEMNGRLDQLLVVERPLLNLLSLLSGVANLTRRFIEAIEGTSTVVCDTRKTTPGLRRLEKYAVRCGGGTCHRIGLHDAVLIKDNHLVGVDDSRLTSFLNERLSTARVDQTLRFVEVEVDTLDQLDAVLQCPTGLVDFVLLDNMTTAELRSAVEKRDRVQPSIALEASGGITLDTVRAVAETGVDRISVGALTHSAIWLDIGLDIAVGEDE